jgi:sirohydrochlorin cobaltochelatase
MAGDEEGSWKMAFKGAGYEVACVIKGLGEYPGVREHFVATSDRPSGRRAVRGLIRSGGPRRAAPFRRNLLSIVGVGPGDPDLITFRAARALTRAT